MDKFAKRAVEELFQRDNMGEILMDAFGKVSTYVSKRYRLLTQELFQFSIKAPSTCENAVKIAAKVQSLSYEEFERIVLEKIKLFIGQTFLQLSVFAEKSTFPEILNCAKQEGIELLVDAACSEISEDVQFNIANMAALISFGFEEEFAKKFVAFVGPIDPEIITSYLDDLASRINQFQNDQSDWCDECYGCNGTEGCEGCNGCNNPES